MKQPTTGSRLFNLRMAAGMTQIEVAKATGQALSTVCKHERNDRGLTAKTIEKYAKLYGVSPVELFVDAIAA